MEFEKKMNEAVSRMKALDLMPQIIREFKNDRELVQYSEPTPIGGILYWISNEPEWMKMVREFEEKYNALVYHAVHSYTEFGELLSLLYVSDCEEEWPIDHEDIPYGVVMTYTINLDENMFSEFSSICVKPAAGGLLRTY